MKKLYGVVTAMVTPFNEDETVRVEAIRQHVDFLIEKGINCLYPLGTTGEMMLMNNEERKLVAETVVKQCDHRIPVFIHVGAMKTKDACELARHACEIGADGIGAVSPAFYGATDVSIYEYYAAISKSVPEDFPIYLYNIPQCSSNDLPVAVADKLAREFKNIIGIKYSFADMCRTLEYQKVNDGNFSVLHGCDKLINALMAMGCDGVVSGVSSVYPEIFVATYQACMRGDWDEARKQQRLANDVCDILKGGASMGHFKEAMKLRGIDAGYVRGPLHNLTQDEILEMKKQLAAIGLQ
ncbi:dihydrodipicolinate synthase family protein [Qiania dongpingensis]|uniref:Dihydrodipicolinate synthase family protein n=2 Tax=Qiania dongpingensis TaxID=2763669 RepID=A0A7G9G8C3_9FIRM|nr:dihydrodipicolinate synthase family protein [Qiania dongpingensis]